MNFSADQIKFTFLTLLTLTGFFVFSSLFFELAPAEYKTKIIKRREPEKMLASLVHVDAVPSPAVLAEAVFAERLLSHEVILAKNEDTAFAPASLVKLMTALLYVEEIPALAPVVMPKEAKAVLENDEKRSGIEAGDVLKAEDMLKLMVAESDNDAAYAAADAVARKADPTPAGATFEARMHRFVFLMNQKKDALGLSHTHFANPSGKDAPDNFSTARDLARLAGEIFVRAPKIWDASRMIAGEVYTLRGANYHFENTDIVLQEFPALFGSKTGFTDEAGGALLMLYELAPNDPIVVVILKSKERFDDGRAILQWLDKSFQLQLK